MTKREEVKKREWLDSGKEEFLFNVQLNHNGHYEYDADDDILTIHYNEGNGLMTLKVNNLWLVPNLKKWIKKILALRW